MKGRITLMGIVPTTDTDQYQATAAAVFIGLRKAMPLTESEPMILA